jgi:SAM-dependent methyltransferase
MKPLDGKKPVFDPAFWHQRLLGAHASGRGLPTAIWDTDPATWNHVNNCTAGLLQRYIRNGRLLDAGCGYGAASDLMPAGVDYCGVDLSPDLVAIARLRYPDKTFLVADLRHLPFADKHFGLALMRSIRDMVKRELGAHAWRAVLTEVLRVSARAMLIEYETPDQCRLVATVEEGM